MKKLLVFWAVLLAGLIVLMSVSAGAYGYSAWLHERGQSVDVFVDVGAGAVKVEGVKCNNVTPSVLRCRVRFGILSTPLTK